VELFFEDVKLTPDTLLGTRGEGLRLILETVGKIRLAHVGARAVGTATRLLSMMIEHARSREQFGRSIGQFQMVQSMLSDSAIEINAARMMVLNAAWEIDQGLEPREKISMVKVYAAEMACRVADRAIQIHGGLGFSKDLPIERLYRDLRVARIYDGTSEIHRGIIARGLLDKGIDILTPPVPSRM
jgi:acyl-CoA dehydrogenase